MSEFVLKNGVGNGDLMKVDKDHRAHIQSLSIGYEDFAVLNGDSFAAAGDIISLTTSTISYLLYIANDNTHDIVVSNFRASIGATTGGANDDWLFTIQINPIGGTLISLGTPTISVNNNLGSAKTLSITALTGIEGSTATGGVPITQLTQGKSDFMLGQKVVIPAGSSFAIGLTPPAGNTATTVTTGVTLIKQTLDIE